MKKLLALVLALVMTLSLCITSNAAFAGEEVNYKEAVEVMNKLGILVGDENGKFNPKDTLTREQAAKIICCMLLGVKTAEKLSVDKAPFTDVAATRWSAPFIAYCAANGIVDGMGDGSFDPAGKLTGHAFGKMLLTALGVEGTFTGASWAINVAAALVDEKLDEDADSVVLSAELTREQAAQFALNALKFAPDGEDVWVVTYTVGDAEKTKEFTEAIDAYLFANLQDADGVSFEKSTEGSLLKDVFDVEYHSSADDAYGRPGVSYYNEDWDDELVFADKADYTYTTSVKEKDLYKAVGKTVAGYTWSNDAAPDKDGGTEDWEFGANGTLTELYVDKDLETVTVVSIETYVGYISDWIEADEDEDVEEAVEVTPYGEVELEEATFETEDFDEDDADDETVVLFTLNADGELETVVAAKKVTGKVTKVTGTESFVVDGKTYKYSANNEVEEDVEVTYKNTYTFYLDEYGYVIYVGEEEEAESETIYAVITKVGTDKSDAFKEKAVAKVVYTDGKEATIPYACGDDVGINEESELPVLVAMTYDEDDKVYEIEAVAEASDVAEFTKGVTAKFGDDVANAKTIFMVAEYDDDDDIEDYTIYTGIRNMISLDDGEFYALGDEGKAVVVLVLNAEDADTEDKAASFVLYDAEAETVEDENGTYVEYAAVVDGKVTTLKVAAEAGVEGNVLAKSLKYDSKGVVTHYDDTEAEVESGTGAVKAAKDDVITFADTGYSYDDDAAVYEIEDGEITKLDGIKAIKSTKTGKDVDFTLVLDDDGVITAVYLGVAVEVD